VVEFLDDYLKKTNLNLLILLMALRAGGLKIKKSIVFISWKSKVGKSKVGR